MKFLCQRCGQCCVDLLISDKNIVRGLTLIPGEQQYFPEDKVKPAVGIGKTPNDKEFRVIAYQLTLDQCPHLINNQCKIYKDRPSSCRQYPFSLELDDKFQTLIGFDMNCPALQKMMESSQNIQLEFVEREAAEKLLELKKAVRINSLHVWLFDFHKNLWLKYPQS